ncbi:condensation domain-containing protein [Dactylosporangium sp. NPDC051485]|uniref:condensation domain-containing protein n=1 Tax=Dactylosporangium sp. NPDC051485 TaxID=3154846 RepID=UPI003422AF1D
MTTIHCRQDPARRAPLMWAQLAEWRAIHACAPGDPRFTLSRVWPVGRPRTIESTMDIIRRLVCRHESLRTRYVADAGPQPDQVVAAEVEVPLAIERFLDPPTREAIDAAVRLVHESPFDISRDVPLRLRFLVHDDAVVHVVVAASHIAVDDWSFEVLRREFYALLDGTVDLPEPLQPADRVAFERSPRGRSVHERTLDYWSGSLGVADEALLRPQPGLAAHTVDCVAIDSVALARAAYAIAQRENVTPSIVVLAATSLLLGVATDSRHCFMRMIYATRHRRGTDTLVAAFNQEAPYFVPLTATTFAGFVHAAGTAALSGFLRSECDCDELGHRVEETLRVRGIPPGGYCFYNDVRFMPGRADDATLAAPAGPARAALAETVTHILPSYVLADAMFFLGVLQLGKVATLTLSKDRRFLPQVSAKRFLLAVEALLVRACEADLPLTDVAALLVDVRSATAVGGEFER